MEEVQGLCLARTALNGEERSACGGGARSPISPVSRMENYAEIFGGFASSCSIPVLMLPEAMEGYKEELSGSQSSGLNYLEIFGVLNAGTFSLSYEEIFSMEKGSKEEDEGDRFLDETDIGQVEKGPPELPAEALVGGHITFSEVNPISSSSHSKFDTVKTSQKSMGDEVKKTICVSSLQTYCGNEFEAETGSPTGFVEDDSSRNVASDDHIFSGCLTEAEEGKQREILNSCSVGATLDAFKNHLNDVHMPPSKGAAYDLKQHSRSSSYHSTSSGDIPVSDYAFLTISDINLRTQPVEVPPPLRAPPKLDVKQGMSKSEALEASNISFNRNYPALNVGGPRTRHALKETVKSTPIYSNVEVDASKAAAMLEAMKQAQASLKSAKEFMERNKNDFGIWNGQNIISSRESKNEAKMAQKVVTNQVERETTVLSEHAEEEATKEKESRSDKLSDEKERSQEWKIDEQFYELVSSEKLIRTRLTNDEKYNSNKDAEPVHRLDTFQYFPDKESVGLQGQRSLHGGDGNDDENKVKMLKSYRINEKKIIPGVEFQMQDGNAKKLKPGIIIDNEDAMNNFETSPLSYLQGDDEDKQIIGRALPVLNDDLKKVVDTISLIQHDSNENELKQCQESCICAEEKNNADGDKEPNACENNGSGLMALCLDRKLEEFNGSEAPEEMLEPVKETHHCTSDVEEVSETSVVFKYGELSSDECMAHSRKADNCNITSEFGISKKFKETKLSGLQNASEVEVDTEYRTSFSHTASYNDGKDSEVESIDNTSKQENRSFCGIDKTSEPLKKQRAKWNIPSRSELNVAKFFIQPDCLEKPKEAFEFQQNEEEKVYEMPQKFENYEGRLTADGEQRTDEKKILGKVKAALELEKKIMGLSATQKVFQRIKVQDSEARRAHSLDNEGNILSPFVDNSRSSWKQMEKSIPDERRDANSITKELLEAEQKRKLEEKERVREREKDMIATRVDCARVFIEARERPENIVLERVSAEVRHRPITAYRDKTEKSSAEAFERFEKVVNEAKLWTERAAVQQATTEVRERAIEKSIAEQGSHGFMRQSEASGKISKDKNWKHNETEGIVRPGYKDSDNNLKPTYDVNDAPIDMKSQSEGYEGESPLRCKARQERCQRIVERAAKALAEKNMRDLLAQRELAERNRLAESLDAEVRRWSSAKEGNLRALLSTLQYILGHDSGWQPIPLTEIITAAAVRKVYRKATLYVHPDKVQQRGASIQHKYICEKVFDLLKDAWNKFNSEG